MSGFAIEKDGNLISVYNLSIKRGFLSAISDFIKANAKILDCYNSPKQPLMEIYAKKLNFKTASIMDYNMDYDHHSIGKRFNYPQVAFMVNTNADIETKHFDKDSYDEAVAYQKSFIEVIPEIANQNNEGLSNIAKRLTFENQKKTFEINNDKYLKDVEKWKMADRLDNDTVEYVYDYMNGRNNVGKLPNYDRVIKINAFTYAEDYLGEHIKDLETWSDELYQSVLKESLDKILEGKKPVGANEQPLENIPFKVCAVSKAPSRFLSLICSSS